MPEDHRIEVNELAVRHALARSFHASDPGDHAWRGSVGMGDARVTVDVLPRDAGDPYVRARSDVLETDAAEPLLARTLVIENGSLVLGRFNRIGPMIEIEHSILAGTHMAAVEVQASVWTVGWAAAAFAPRLRALLTEATPPPAPETPAGRLRDSADHVEMTTRRVHHFLDERFGGFQHHPDWGFHGAFGSARVFVDVLPVLDDSTAVRASSPVVSDIDLTDKLAIHLLELAGEGPFGTYLYLPARREVWFQHAILGDDLDESEFEAAIEVVADTADGEDDDLVAEFGGRRYADLESS